MEGRQRRGSDGGGGEARPAGAAAKAYLERYLKAYPYLGVEMGGSEGSSGGGGGERPGPTKAYRGRKHTFTSTNSWRGGGGGAIVAVARDQARLKLTWS